MGTQFRLLAADISGRMPRIFRDIPVDDLPSIFDIHVETDKDFRAYSKIVTARGEQARRYTIVETPNNTGGMINWFWRVTKRTITTNSAW